MRVVKVVDENVAGKVDTRYIAEQFPEVQNVGIVFICTSEGGEEDDWVDDKSGMRCIVIHLPYKEVIGMRDARPLMLQKVKERLGLVSSSSLN
jgi:hypothetical protein